jgi:hypothetical protein
MTLPLEGAKQAAGEAANGQFFEVPGADHQAAGTDVGYVGPRVKAFLDSVAVQETV